MKPDVISIDYSVDPKKISEDIDITVQGGLNPNILLQSEKEIINNAKKYFDAFKGLPYIFNIGHGILPETDPNMLGKLIKFYREY